LEDRFGAKMARKRSDHSEMQGERAEAIAIEALGFIAGDEARLVQFLRVTGYDPAAIRAEAGSPFFLAGVLDFLLGDESLLLVFASHGGIDPAEIAAARRTLARDDGNQD
jgi:hypothetical protein